MELQQGFHEIILGGHDGIAQHQHHHDLPRGMSHPYQHMAQQPPARVLVVRPYLEGFQKPPDGHDDFIRLLILYQTTVYGDDAVALLLIGAGNGPVPRVLPEGRVDLVAVMVGVVHGDDVLRPAVGLHEPAELRGLGLKLLSVAFVDPLAAPAFGGYGAQLLGLVLSGCFPVLDVPPCLLRVLPSPSGSLPVSSP